MTSLFDNENHSEEPEQSGEGSRSGNESKPSHGGGAFPEPPVRWRPESSVGAESGDDAGRQPSMPNRVAEIGSTQFQLVGKEIYEFESARRIIRVSQIAALVSLFIGGVLLSAAAVVCAAVANRKLGRIASAHEGDLLMQAVLKRAGIMAVVVTVMALVINIVTLIVLYPVVMDTVQSGILPSLFGGGLSAPAGGGSSTWG